MHDDARSPAPSVLTALAAAVNPDLPFDAAVERALTVLGETLGFPYGEVWLPPAEATFGCLTLHPAWHGDRQRTVLFRTAGQRTLITPGQGPVGQALERREPVWYPDLGAIPAGECPRRDEAAAGGFGSCLVLPAGQGGPPVVLVALWGPAALTDRPPHAEDLPAAAAFLGAVLRCCRAEERLGYLATHDPVTGLANRTALGEALERAVAGARRGTPSALIFLDLDGFKLVNDTLGHQAGDELLRSVARRLRATLRGSDVLARFGGDEFVALLPGAAADQALAAANRLREAVASCQAGAAGRAVSLDASAGVVAVDGTLPPDALLSRADAAMYTAKQQGGRRAVLARPGEDPAEPLAEAGRWVSQLRHALGEDRFTVHYQPVVRLTDGEVVGYEALLRLREPDGDVTPAGAFWRAAERFGLAPEIDRWVVARVLRDLAAHPEATFWANLSGRTLADPLARDAVAALVSAAGPGPDRLGFEITETAAIPDLAAVAAWMAALREAGVRFAWTTSARASPPSGT